MANVIEQAEHLATSLLPLPYAQLTRLLMLIFLCLVPIAYVQKLGWVMVPLSFTASTVYFLVDECSGQMETPFGTELNDVEIEKTLRRMDKLSAAQLYQFTRTSDAKPISNFNLYPESRTTDLDSVTVTRKLALMGDEKAQAVRLAKSNSHSSDGRHSPAMRVSTGAALTQLALTAVSPSHPLSAHPLPRAGMERIRSCWSTSRRSSGGRNSGVPAARGADEGASSGLRPIEAQLQVEFT